MSTITQVHSITPDQLSEMVSEAIRSEINTLKKDFQPIHPPQYLTRKETVKKLGGISLVCLHDWTRKGILTAYKIGNRVFYKSDEIEATLQESKKGI